MKEGLDLGRDARGSLDVEVVRGLRDLDDTTDLESIGEGREIRSGQQGRMFGAKQQGRAFQTSELLRKFIQGALALVTVRVEALPMEARRELSVGQAPEAPLREVPKRGIGNAMGQGIGLKTANGSIQIGVLDLGNPA